MKRFLLLSLTVIFAACGGMKLADSSYSKVTNGGTERDQYVFTMNKKPGDYMEIVEVRLRNEEKNMDESVPFQVMDENAEKTVLDVKGRKTFTVVAEKIAGDATALATNAIIVYRTEKEGSNEYFKVKKIGSSTAE